MFFSFQKNTFYLKIGNCNCFDAIIHLTSLLSLHDAIHHTKLTFFRYWKIFGSEWEIFLPGTEYFLFLRYKLSRMCLKYFIMDYTFSFPTFLEVLLFSQLESCVFTLFCAPPRALIMRYRTKAGSSFTSGGLTCFLS